MFMLRIFLALVVSAQVAMAKAPVDPLQNKTIRCTAPDAPSHVRSPFTLTLMTSTGYHRDGQWYATRFNASSITTFIFTQNLSDLSSGYAAGFTYNAMIYRDWIKMIHLVDVRGSSHPEKWPVGFRGKAILFDDSTRSLDCSYVK